MNDQPPKPPLTYTEAAAILGVSEHSIARLACYGVLERIPTPPIVTAESVEFYLANRQEKASVKRRGKKKCVKKQKKKTQ